MTSASSDGLCWRPSSELSLHTKFQFYLPKFQNGSRVLKFLCNSNNRNRSFHPTFHYLPRHHGTKNLASRGFFLSLRFHVRQWRRDSPAVESPADLGEDVWRESNAMNFGGDRNRSKLICIKSLNVSWVYQIAIGDELFDSSGEMVSEGSVHIASGEEGSPSTILEKWRRKKKRVLDAICFLL